MQYQVRDWTPDGPTKIVSITSCTLARFTSCNQMISGIVTWMQSQGPRCWSTLPWALPLLAWDFRTLIRLARNYSQGSQRKNPSSRLRRQKKEISLHSRTIIKIQVKQEFCLDIFSLRRLLRLSTPHFKITTQLHSMTMEMIDYYW
jgi:hypothetical protein